VTALSRCGATLFAHALVWLWVMGPGILHAGLVSRDHFHIEPQEAETYLVSFSFTGHQLSAFPYADREDHQAPAYVQMIELSKGRSAWIDRIDMQLQPVPSDLQPAKWEIVSEAPLSATLARMGRRVFLRVEIRPYQYDHEQGVWSQVSWLEAELRIADVDEERQHRVGAQRSVMSTASDDVPCLVCPPRMPVGVSAGMGGTPGEFHVRRPVTNDVAWRIGINTAGLYRITGAQLTAAGLPPQYLDSAHLRITVRDQSIPIWRSTSGAMNANDWLMFYGAAVDSKDTRENVYWLSVGDSSPDVELVSSPIDPSLGSVSSFRQLVEYAPQNLFRPSYRPLASAFDHWFAHLVPGNTTSNISFATPRPVTTGTVYLAYSLHGLNSYSGVDPDHRSVLRVGGQIADTREYKGEVPVSGVGMVAGTALQSGITTVSVQQVLLAGIPLGAAGAASAYVESLSLCYERQLHVEQYPFYFNSPASAANLTISNATITTARLVNVSNAFAPFEISAINKSNATWRFVAQGGQCYALFNEQSIHSVSSLELTRFRGLGSVQRQADYLVVTPNEFREPVFNLLKHRHKNNLTVQAASVSDVYNEFGFGLKVPEAIRQYFGYAYHHYQKEPLYALLVGVGSFDPLNSLGLNRPEYIPVRMGPAPFRRTALDQWFVTVDGPDLLPDIMLGRLPVVDAVGVSNAIRKIISFDTAMTNAAWRETALLVADKKDSSLDFKAHVEASTKTQFVDGGFDELFGIETVYRDDVTVAQAVQSINSSIDGGVHFVHYMGHGSVAQWSSPLIWNTTNAMTRTNTVYPLIAVFSCQVGAFHDPASHSLVEAVLTSTGSGSGSLAPTALSVQQRAEYIADGFYEAMVIERVPHFGQAMASGFLKLYQFNPFVSELQFYALFGDPASLVWGAVQP